MESPANVYLSELENKLPCCSSGRLVARLVGGLGNQLFIYAAARGMAAHLGRRLLIDGISGFIRDSAYRREYLLDQFAITAESARPVDCFVGRLGSIRESIAVRCSRTGLFRKHWFFLEGPSAQQVPNAQVVYMRGYWQSEQYFAAIRSEIRREFRVRPLLSSVASTELVQIEAQCQPAAVGVRRFAEVSHHEVEYVADRDYYQRAMAALLLRAPATQVFIFTDDEQWARANLKCELPHTFISSKLENRRAYQDLVLMSRCRNFIIGNSTFHWWGAWLAAGADKVVIIPRVFAEAKPEFYPREWERL